jgi:hypothetical protein
MRVQMQCVARPLFVRAILTIATAVAFGGGCGGGGSTTNPLSAIAVTMTPTAFSMQAGQTQAFTATVDNDSASKGVTWALSGSGCTGAACGTLSAPGSASGVAVTYTAPATAPTPATVTLTATSVADPTKKASATITLTAIAVSVSPATATVAVGLTQTFTATVTNDAQTKGVTWALSQPGATCTTAICGTLSATSGSPLTYTAPASIPPAGVTLTATSAADTTKAATAAITVSNPAVSVTITPKRGGVVVGQTLNLTATVTNDVAAMGVTWTASSGTVTAQTATTATFTAPTSPGAITVTATSKMDGTKSASVPIGVTDLAGVTTYHNDLSRDGANVQEYALNTSNVAAATFGRLFSCTVDGAVAAQPLWVPNLNFGGTTGTHNVIVVATQRDSVYVFDADTNNCSTPYWQKQLIPTGETYGNFGDVGTSDIFPDIGITGTPVIDPKSNTIYLVTKTKNTGTTTYHHRLHALSLTTGAEATNSPVEVAATVTGNCEGGTTISFNSLRQNQRPGLAFNPANHTLYVGFASHGDVDMYHGWVMAYDTTNLTAAPGVFNTTPNTVAGQGFCQAGIWMSGGAPAIDPASNDVFLSTGNGAFDGMTDFGDSYLRLNATLSTVKDYFAPFNQGTLAPNDLDIGSSGATLLVDQTAGPKPHLLIGGSKSSVFYVLDRDNLGKFNSAGGATSDPAVIQEFGLSGASFSTPGFWNNTLFYFGTLLPTTNLIPGQSFAFDPTAGKFNPTPTQQTPSSFGFAGATPAISASSATTDGIVWAIDAGAFGTGDTVKAAGPAVLHAFDASNLSKELWNSSQAAGGRDAAGNAVKFTVPTVANGKVYIGTRGSDDTTGNGTTFGEVDVYGLLPD